MLVFFFVFAHGEEYLFIFRAPRPAVSRSEKVKNDTKNNSNPRVGGGKAR